MAFFGAAMAALKTLKALKANQAGGSELPVDNSHSHGGGGVDPVSDPIASGRSTVKGDVSRVDSGMIAPNFMDQNQDKFSSLTDPLSVDRGGRTVSRQDDSASLDPVGIEPAMNPALATPVDVDKQGVNSLY